MVTGGFQGKEEGKSDRKIERAEEEESEFHLGSGVKSVTRKTKERKE